MALPTQQKRATATRRSDRLSCLEGYGKTQTRLCRCLYIRTDHDWFWFCIVGSPCLHSATLLQHYPIEWTTGQVATQFGVPIGIDTYRYMPFCSTFSADPSHAQCATITIPTSYGIGVLHCNEAGSEHELGGRVQHSIRPHILDCH